MVDARGDNWPVVTLTSEIKERLQSQQAIVDSFRGDHARTHIRAELDALWECVEVIAQVLDGMPPEHAIVRDYFGDSAKRRRDG